MNVQEQIKKYIISQPEPKRSDMQVLHLCTLLSRNISQPCYGGDYTNYNIKSIIPVADFSIAGLFNG